MSRPLPSSFDGDSDFYEESRIQKLIRRLKQEPLIPLGCVLTSWALLNASRSIRTGNHIRTNRMFRARIYAQAFTIAAMVAGSMYWQTDREKQKELDKLIEERKAKEKKERWLEELEYRDREAKEEHFRREAFRKSREAINPNMSARSDNNTDSNPAPVAGKEEKKGVIESVNELVSENNSSGK